MCTCLGRARPDASIFARWFSEAFLPKPSEVWALQWTNLTLSLSAVTKVQTTELIFNALDLRSSDTVLTLITFSQSFFPFAPHFCFCSLRSNPSAWAFRGPLCSLLQASPAVLWVLELAGNILHCCNLDPCMTWLLTLWTQLPLQLTCPRMVSLWPQHQGQDRKNFSVLTELNLLSLSLQILTSYRNWNLILCLNIVYPGCSRTPQAVLHP